MTGSADMVSNSEMRVPVLGLGCWDTHRSRHSLQSRVILAVVEEHVGDFRLG